MNWEQTTQSFHPSVKMTIFTLSPGPLGSLISEHGVPSVCSSIFFFPCAQSQVLGVEGFLGIRKIAICV